MKYSKGFDRDYNFYKSNIDLFSFSGSQFDYPSKHCNVIEDCKGVTAKESFYYWESNGEIVPTKEPKLLKGILKAKSSINLHIKEWAMDRAKAYLPKIVWLDMVKEMNLPQWVYEAVENQKSKYYPNHVIESSHNFPESNMIARENYDNCAIFKAKNGKWNPICIFRKTNKLQIS
jgi:hypothetical protein